MRPLAFYCVCLFTAGMMLGAANPSAAANTRAGQPNEVTVGASVSIDDVTQFEGISGTTNFVFSVSLSFPVAVGVTVDFETADGTAMVVDDDYVSTSGTATIPAFQTSATITVQVKGDNTQEPDETFFVNLLASNAKIADAQGLGTILDDDPPSISISNASEAEGDAGTTSFDFVVILSNPTDMDVMVDFATVSGTAIAGVDYQSVSGTATILAGSLSTIISVLVNGDTDAENHEAFTVLLSNPSSGTLSAKNPGTGNILNDDGIVGVGNPAITEFALGRMAPNPSRGITRFDYALPHASHVRVSILDVQGREVAVVTEGWHQAGRHLGTWDGRVGHQTAPAGVYFVRYQTPVRAFVERLVLVR